MNTTPYSLFVDKCSTYKIKVEVKEDTFDELRGRFEHFPINDLLDWLWANGKHKVTTLRILNWMKKSKDFARQSMEKKQEFYQKENEENESKRAVNMKKADERAREKARTDKPPTQEVCKTDPLVLQWIQNNPKRYHEGVKYMAKQSLEEHPSLGMLSHDKLKTIAVARLNTLLEKKITTK